MQILNIINNTSYYTHSKWAKVNPLNKADEKFVALLFPIFEYVYQTLSPKTIPLQPYITKHLLEKTIAQELTKKFSPMIARVCVLEMHSVAARGFLHGTTPKERFADYIKLLQQSNNATDLLKKYTALSHALEISTAQYITEFSEFLQRFIKDRKQLYAQFLENNSGYRLAALHSSGDSHKQGHAVKILCFKTIKTKKAKGAIKKVLYKPRSLAIDIAFYKFLTWINQRSSFNHLIASFVAQDSYAWCEYIEYKTCRTKQGITKFYQRAGSLLAALYLLSGSDIHSENLIAHGAYPVIIDLECLMRPHLALQNNSATEIIHSSVSDSLFLPQRMMTKEGYSGFDISALLGRGGQRAPYLHIDFEHAGTDKMYAKRLQTKLPKHQNIPSLRDTRINPLEYEATFARGFITTIKLFIQHKTALLSKNSPLNFFKGAEVRVVLRNTADYAKLLYESYHPKLWFLRELRKQHFAWLNTIAQSTPAYQYVIPSELEDLNTGNIPFFSLITDTKVLQNSKGNSLKIQIIKSGMAVVKQRLRSQINAADLRKQTAIIHNSYVAARLNAGDTAPTTNKITPTNAYKHQYQSTLHKEAMAMTKLLLNQLTDLAIYNGDNIAWPTITANYHTPRAANMVWQAQMTDINLYAGAAGIGLVFAYAGLLLNNKHYTKIAKACCASIQKELDTQLNNKVMAVGAFIGVGGLIYALSHFYKLWDKANFFL